MHGNALSSDILVRGFWTCFIWSVTWPVQHPFVKIFHQNITKYFVRFLCVAHLFDLIGFFFIIQSPLVDSCGYGTVVLFLRFKLLNQWIETESILVCVCFFLSIYLRLLILSSGNNLLISSSSGLTMFTLRKKINKWTVNVYTL